MAVYCDELCAGSLAWLALRQRGRPCRYLSAAPGALALARLLHAARILRHLPEPARIRLCDITTPAGEVRYHAILGEVCQACMEAGSRDLREHPFLRVFGGTEDGPAFSRFLEKALHERLLPLFMAANAVMQREPPEPRPILLHGRGPGDPQVRGYGDRIGLATATYFSPRLDPSGLLLRRLRAALPGSRSAGPPRAALPPRPRPAPDRGGGPGRPLISAWFVGQKVTFDEKLRTAFCWLLKTPAPKKQVLLYFNRRDVPLDQEGAALLAGQGVRTVALDPRADASGTAPLWRPGAVYARERGALLRRAAWAGCRSALQGRPPGRFHLLNALRYGHHYAYWRDFFAAHGVRVNVSPDDYCREYLPMNRALRDSGGISVSYQFSNLWFRSLPMSACSDVMFCFGPSYKPFWESNGSDIGYLVYTGYVSDSSFKANQPDARALRARLLAAGARHIVGFFDENSSDDPLSLIPNQRSQEIYRGLAQKVLSDPGFGLICKPGYPRTLRQRLGAETAALIDRAQATGRCVFLDQGAYVTDRYPTLAAQAADVCVGLLLSGTAALEAFLSGTPTVFLDLERLYSNPVYASGKGRIVFDSLDGLCAGLDAYFGDPSAFPGFGDLSDWAQGKDPYRDGRAAERAGDYIAWLYDAFAAGGDREAALASANARFRARWGADSVVPMRGPGSAP